MEPLKQTEDRIRGLKPETETSAAMDSRILMDSYAQMPKSQVHSNDSGPNILRKILMKNSIKLTAAAVILIAATLSLTLLDTTVPSAYALEQTIEALNAMRSIHVRMHYPGFEEPVMIWTQFHENGQIKALRVSQSRLAAGDPHDGPKEAVLMNNIAQLWLKDKNIVFNIKDQQKAAEIGAFFHSVDPKLFVQKLMQMQHDNSAEVVIEQPDQIDEPITITVSSIEEKPFSGRGVIALVDQATKLVISLEILNDGRPVYPEVEHFGMEDFSQLEFFDYNQSFAEDIFTLNVPDDTVVIDQVDRLIGLAQGQMSTEEVSVEVVRQFLDNIINEDFEAAGLLYQGVPASLLQENYGPSAEGHIVQVISIGQPHPHPNPDYDNALLVPCVIEIERDGIREKMTKKYMINEVAGQPNRFTICGEF